MSNITGGAFDLIVSTIVSLWGNGTDYPIKRLDTNGQEVDYDKWTGAEVDGKKRPNLKQFRVDMAKTMVDKQTAEVDTITGATTTSKGWVQLVERALEKTKNLYGKNGHKN